MELAVPIPTPESHFQLPTSHLSFRRPPGTILILPMLILIFAHHCALRAGQLLLKYAGGVNQGKTKTPHPRDEEFVPVVPP
jgi:hypothetical protein